MNNKILEHLKHEIRSESNGTQYITQTTYVNEETGEILRHKDATNKEKYIIIKTDYNGTEYNTTRTHATIIRTARCRKQPQLTISGI